MKGHESGHAPAGVSWGELVHAWREEHGGWAALADQLIRRAGGAVEMPSDPGSIEKGLRRLAQRGGRDGGQYGRWALRFLGVPTPVALWLRWMGQYHHRFSDLPVSLRRQQLAMWDGPPVQGSPAGAWIDLGMASVGLRSQDHGLVQTRMQRVAARLERIEVSAQLEWHLLDAYLADDAESRLRAAEALVEDARLEPDDRQCYRARVLDMRAYRALRDDTRDAIDTGQRLYEAIDADSSLPFVCFRRANGLAYCALRRGQQDAAYRLALEAADHAGDGGFVRFRIMALSLASRAADPAAAASLSERADRLAERLEDEDLRSRLRRH
ncbi:MAG: hypothetical protein AB8I08_21635 [Sandaracinaceae bacterium]